jgi:proteasome component ECM29
LTHLQFHAQSYNMTAEQFEGVRLSVDKGSPLHEAIDSCLRLVDQDTIAPVLTTITDVLRTGVGLPCLTAAAKAISTLASQPLLAPHMAQGIKPVMLRLHHGLLDRSPTVRKCFSSALGYCCKIAPVNTVSKAIGRLLAFYTDEGSDTGRVVAGVAMW